MICFRIQQGLAGGGLQPSSQGVLLDSFPAEKQGSAMTLFGIAALIAPILGPTLGGYITDHYSWRWIFYISIPVGGLRQQQASALGYFDTFWFFAVLGFSLVLLIPLMKRSVAEKGAHIAAE